MSRYRMVDRLVHLGLLPRSFSRFARPDGTLPPLAGGADNVSVSAGSGTTLATDETSINGTTAHVQRVTTGAAPSLSTGAVTATTTSGLLIAANYERKGLLIKNFGSVTAYLGTTPATTSMFPLDPGETLSSQTLLAAVYCITGSSTTSLRYWEEA